MPILKNDDINLMIKMENLIGDNQRKLFNRKGEYKYKFRDFTTGEIETESLCMRRGNRLRKRRHITGRTLRKGGDNVEWKISK